MICNKINYVCLFDTGGKTFDLEVDLSWVIVSLLIPLVAILDSVVSAYYIKILVRQCKQYAINLYLCQQLFE
jgi:hypothetical protein